MPSSRSSAGRLLRIVLGCVALLAIGAVAGWVFVYVNFIQDLPDLLSLEDYQPSLTSVVLDRDGSLADEVLQGRGPGARVKRELERAGDGVRFLLVADARALVAGIAAFLPRMSEQSSLGGPVPVVYSVASSDRTFRLRAAIDTRVVDLVR